MNNNRRIEISAVLSQIEELRNLLDTVKDSIEGIRDEEQEYFDNMPESLQGGERGAKAEEAVGYLFEAFDALDDIDLDSVRDSLETAAE